MEISNFLLYSTWCFLFHNGFDGTSQEPNMNIYQELDKSFLNYMHYWSIKVDWSENTPQILVNIFPGTPWKYQWFRAMYYRSQQFVELNA